MKKKFLQGTIKRHPDGFGFFIPDEAEHADVYIPRHSMKGVMTNDKVMIEVFPEKGSQRFRGEILKILSRGTKVLVGTYYPMNEQSGLIRDEGKGWGEDLRIRSEDSMGAKEKELVSVEITGYPGEAGGFRGKVTSVIGHSMDPLTDIKRVLLQNHIPHEFHPEVAAEAKRFSELVSASDMKGRRNIQNLNFITIDGATAKDFDDAVLVKSHSQGFKLYVAIADVSHYVRVGTAIDREAYERGTSVYFPNFVVPMLPEVLSNGLCSLNPHVPRLALVAEIELSFTGEIMKTDFYEAVIESKARVTYGEAQEIIDGNEVEKIKHVKEEILLAADLAKILMAKRFRDGSLDLEIPETQIVLDSAGIPIDFIRSERLFAHRLIEEMMLAANVAVASFFSEKEIAAIYRIHEPPNPDAIELLNRYLTTFGGRVNVQQGKLQKRLTRALQEFEGKPESQILNILTLRSMSQAKYSSDNVGHFGLGFEFYTHFTSPIRRYPDLIVHRLLKSLIMPESTYRQIPEEDLQTAATMLSACEQRSVKAERQFQAIKKARFLEKFMGQEFDGIISSVTKFGVFVLLRQYEVDGLVRAENLSKEKMEFDEDNLVLYGRRSGLRFAIGDFVRVRVENADPEAGQVDFGLVLGHDSPQASERQSSRREQRKSGRRGDRAQQEARQETVRKGRQEKPRDRDRDQERETGRGRERQRDRQDVRPEKRARPTSSSGGPSPVMKSKKARALDQIEEKVFQVLEEASSETSGRGEKFDPEKHLQQALRKWRERNADIAPAPRSAGQMKNRAGSGSSQERSAKSSKPGDPQPRRKDEERGSSKSSSKRGRRR